jgi:hypothetical protein
LKVLNNEIQICFQINLYFLDEKLIFVYIIGKKN